MSFLDDIDAAVDAELAEDQRRLSEAGDRVGEMPSTMGTVLGQQFEASAAPIVNLGKIITGDTPPQDPARPTNPFRVLETGIQAGMAVINMPIDLINAGVAVAMGPLAALYGQMDAATLGSLYMAPPHGHLHPPSFTPPATPAPVPLPSFGPIILGTSIQIFIAGMPAARAGDLGWAMSCGGFTSLFEVFCGSSSVFIGGTRAARWLDISKACTPSTAGPVRGVAAALKAAGLAQQIAGIAANSFDAATEPDPYVAQAMALAAAMGAASMAADAVTAALAATMGLDAAAPPIPGAVTMGCVPTVKVGGFPMINIPNPVEALMLKMEKRRQQRREEAEGGEESPRRGQSEDDEEGVVCSRCRGG